MKNSLIVAALGLLLGTSASLAYEVSTHASMTKNAYERSVLFKDPSKLQDLGFTGLPTLGGVGISGAAIYLDVFGTSIEPRGVYQWEGDKIQNFTKDLFSPLGWLMNGAIREDDVLPGFSDDPNPNDDPYNTGDLAKDNRVVNHFYDPPRNRALTVPSLFGNRKAPDWALGVQDFSVQPLQADTSRRNHFTVLDAREAMFRALTLKQRAPDGTLIDVPPVPGMSQMRSAYWATAFRALGDVLHLNQDMGQPQHTRNDKHGGQSFTGAIAPFGHMSFYEKYIDARATGLRFASLSGPINTRPLTYQLCDAQGANCADYPIPNFTKYGDFWTTAPGSISGNGLADYSNRGFFSVGTNLGHNDYAAPSNNSNDYGFETLLPASATNPGGAKNMAGAPLSGAVTLLTATVADTLNPSQTAPSQRLTTYGLWDQFLQEQGAKPDFTLNYYNYDAMANQLVPRAVGYSAGLINYFFRGKLEITPPAEGVYGAVDQSVSQGFGTLKLNLRNVTPNSEVMSGGKLVAVATFRRNHCYQPDLSDTLNTLADTKCIDPEPTIILSQERPPPANFEAAPQPVTFDFSQNPIPLSATNLIIQVVYRGPLGQEGDAVVVATKDVSEPTFYALFNSTDAILVNGIFYTVDYIKGNLGLFPQLKLADRLDPQYEATDLAIQFNFTSSNGRSIGAINPLPPGRFSRLALITDQAPSFSFIGVGPQVTFYGTTPFAPAITQFDSATGIYHIALVRPTRGVNSYGGMLVYRFFGTESFGDSTKLPPLNPAPVPVNITFPLSPAP